MAGGMTPYAATGKIKILRRSNGSSQAIAFDYNDIEKGQKLDQNIVLSAGDVVVVP
jgi:polysaccharide export outer membrane protein